MSAKTLKNCPTSSQFLNVPMFRNVTLKCLTEIAGVSVSQYEEQFVTLFTLTMCQLKQVSSRTDASGSGVEFSSNLEASAFRCCP